MISYQTHTKILLLGRKCNEEKALAKERNQNDYNRTKAEE